MQGWREEGIDEDEVKYRECRNFRVLICLMHHEWFQVISRRDTKLQRLK
jgi:hypothetical protein